MLTEVEIMAAAVNADWEQLETSTDGRSNHIKQSCQGHQTTYNVAVGTFAVGATASIVALAAGGPLGWAGIKAYAAGNAALLAAVNVAGAMLNECKYNAGRDWDQNHE